MKYLLQYQVLTEPVSTQPERTTPDKWQPNTSTPKFDKKRWQFLYPPFAVGVFEEEPASEVSVDSWSPNTSIPRFDKFRWQYAYPTFFSPNIETVDAETPQLDKWFRETSIPRFDRPRRQWSYPSDFSPDWGLINELEVSLDLGWEPSYPDIIFDRQRWQFIYPYLAFYPTPITSIVPFISNVLIVKVRRTQYQSLAQPLPDRFGDWPNALQDLTISPFMLGTTELRTEMSSREYNAYVSALELQPIISTDQVVR